MCAHGLEVHMSAYALPNCMQLIITGAGVYAVLGRRRARIVREELREGSGHFSVHAFLPMQARPGARARACKNLSRTVDKG